MRYLQFHHCAGILDYSNRNHASRYPSIFRELDYGNIGSEVYDVTVDKTISKKATDPR
jgi:hypothetical protein